ncbi:MAG TPA: hypothetical protein VK611_25160 [Acidimicrobiales bacterium]|nr:hypothetical protein [Acidimicrobiales bacterium]
MTTLGFSQSIADSILNGFGNAANWTAPTAVWIQLHDGDPGSAGTANIADNTTRTQASFGSPATNAATRRILNDTDITWVDVAAAEDYTHWSAWTLVTAGTFLGDGLMTANALLVGDDFVIPAGDIEVNLLLAT